MQPKYILKDRAHLVALVRRSEEFTLEIDGHLLDVRYQQLSRHHAELTINGTVHQVYVAQDGNRLFVHHDGKVWQLDAQDEFDDTNSRKASDGCINAPMPGVVVGVYVERGQWVEEGATLMLIESMKLQSEIKAMSAGVVEMVGVESGASFNKGELLVEVVVDEESTESEEVK